MNPQIAANQLSRYGRGGDTSLMHVQPREMQGIATLLGRPITRNPATGLPEAFSFGDILPMVAGIGGSIFGGPLVGALASGATKTAVTGDLAQGIMTGLGSYAMAGFAGGLADAGAAVNGGAADGVAANAFQGAEGPIPPPPPVPPPPPPPPVPSGGGIGPAAAAVPAADIAATAPPPPAPGAMESVTQFGKNIGTALSTPGVAMDYIKAHPLQSLGAVGGAMMTMGDLNKPTMPPPRRGTSIRYNPTAPSNGWEPPDPGYNMNPGTGFIRNFAEGGVASLEGGARMQSLNAAKNLMSEATAALLGEHPRPKQAIERFEDAFGPAMLAALRTRVLGGKVEGAGGGLDDLVPGSIEGREKVRLADGEFVVPADVVSGLGDGSTEHGARKLHEMMGRVRRERTGKEEQPGAVDDEEVMPA